MKVSRLPVGKEKMSLFLDDFWTAVASLEDKAEARMFFSQFLTHTERKMFAKRFQIAMMLILDYDYQTIKQRLKVSDTTTARISNWLEDNGGVIASVAKRIIHYKEQKMLKMESSKRSIKGRSGGRSIIEEGAGEIFDLIKKKKKERSLLE